MGNALEKSLSKAATEAGLLEIEQAEINFTSDINLNMDSSSIGIVVAVVCGLIIVIIIVISLCSKYCCNCCDNLCFQGRGQNKGKNRKQIHASHDQHIHNDFQGFPIEPSKGCPSCGSQVGAGTIISPTSNFGGTIKRAPSAAPSYFAHSAVRDDTKFDGIVIPVANQSEYHTLNDQEKIDILNTQSYPTIQYCTMANGEVGMYLPKNQTMLSILERSSTMQKSSTRACRTRSTRKADYFATEDELKRSRTKRQDQSPTKRKRRRSKQSARSQRSSDKGYKSDSSQFRSKSQTTTQTTASPLSSLSDVEDVEIEMRSSRSRRSSKAPVLPDEEPPLYSKPYHK